MNKWVMHASYYIKTVSPGAKKFLDKIKQTAKANNQELFNCRCYSLRKKIEALTHNTEHGEQAEQLSHEVDEVNTQLSLMSKLSSLSLQLYSWYIKNGSCQDEKDVAAVKMFFEANLPPCSVSRMHFYEKMYLYQSHCWYGFILQDLLMYYRYAQKWVDIFDQEPFMKK